MVLLKEFFEKLILKEVRRQQQKHGEFFEESILNEVSRQQQKHEILHSMQRIKRRKRK